MKKWIDKIYFLIFISLCSVSVFGKEVVYGKIFMKKNNYILPDLYKTCALRASVNVIRILLPLLVIWIFQRNFNEERQLHPDKKLMRVFLAEYAFFILMVWSFTKPAPAFLKRIPNCQAFMDFATGIIVISIACMFKVKFKNFNLNMKLRDAGMIMLVLIFYFAPFLLFTGKAGLEYHQYNMSLANYLKGNIFMFIHPGFTEEFVYRGVLVNALKGYGIDDMKVNIIQSVFFAIPHMFMFHGLGMGASAVLMTGYQAMFGYVMGKMYLSTKSLAPCIIVHTLFDLI